MNYLTYSKRLEYLMEMIEKGQVISLKDVSVKFDCSERTIKRMIKTLRGQGYNINYCKKTQKYYREFK